MINKENKIFILVKKKKRNNNDHTEINEIESKNIIQISIKPRVGSLKR